MSQEQDKKIISEFLIKQVIYFYNQFSVHLLPRCIGAHIYKIEKKLKSKKLKIKK